MNHYSTYDAIALAHDDKFRRWVKRPEQYPELVAFWEAWIEAHPERAAEVEDAILLIEALDGEEPAEQPAEERVWQRVQQSVDQTRRPARTIRRSPVSYGIAASVALLLLASIAFWFTQRPATPLTVVSLESPTVITNATPLPQTVLLPDSSSVVLYPNSTLSHPIHFAADQRNVRLTGRGFFEVRKDPTRPFVVRAERVVSTVLGTSFLVSDFEDQPISTVQVKTGLVSVASAKATGNASRPDPVVLHPYQQAALSEADAALTVTQLSEYDPTSALARYDFTFRDAPLQDVFTRLGQVYQINIMYDDQILMDDLLNANLEDMPLPDKLRVICKALGLTYSYDGSTVYLQAPHQSS